MTDPDLLIRIDENVKYLVKARQEDKAAFDAHVLKDDKIVADYIKPLWEQRQQDIGARRAKNWGITALDKALTIIISVTATIAAIKGIK